MFVKTTATVNLLLVCAVRAEVHRRVMGLKIYTVTQLDIFQRKLFKQQFQQNSSISGFFFLVSYLKVKIQFWFFSFFFFVNARQLALVDLLGLCGETRAICGDFLASFTWCLLVKGQAVLQVIPATEQIFLMDVLKISGMLIFLQRTLITAFWWPLSLNSLISNHCLSCLPLGDTFCFSSFQTW